MNILRKENNGKHFSPATEFKKGHIPTDRGDFLKDVSIFMHKHRFALEISNEFYYVCPWGLIDKSEAPDVTGLLYVNKGHKIQKKKVAKLRTKDGKLSIDYVQALLQQSKKRINYAEIPVTYLGKNWTQKDFMELVEEEAQKKIKRLYDYEIERKVENKLKEEDAYCLKFSKILRMAGLNYLNNEHEAMIRLEKVIKRGLAYEEIKYCVEQSIKKLSHIVQRFPKETS